MKVILYPTDAEKLTGQTSSMAWKNPQLVAAINKLFRVTPGERIVQVEVDNYGLTVRFESLPEPASGEVTPNE